MRNSSRRLSVAPMMEWTDRHCRFMHRLISRHTLLYTEMIAAAGIVRGPRQRLLAFSAEERPVALQLGGSEPRALAEAVRIAADFGYDEINLNVGCPSDRVRHGAFGACLMKTPDLVAECCAAMIQAAGGGPEITVKTRIGVDEQAPEQALPEFIDRVAAAGVRSFSVHARKAWLKGLSPKENRSVPPLDYELVYAVKRARPELEIVLNGGVGSLEEALAHLARGVDGVMIGRAAYQAPMDILAQADSRIFGDQGAAPPAAEEIVERMIAYIEARMAQGARLHDVTRHMLGLFSGRPGARAWRRMLSDRAHRPGAGAGLLRQALEASRPETAGATT